MKKFYNVLICFLIFLAFEGNLIAATYYVNAATGSNSRSSSQAKNIETPWLSVQNAIDNPDVTDGDNIIVAVGSYPGFMLTKRLNIIGFWKGSSSSSSTIFNSVVSLRAPGGSPTNRMVLRNLRVSVTTGDAIDMRSSYVTMENVFATATSSAGLSGLRVNAENLFDLFLESCNFNGSFYSGIHFPSFASLNGFIMRNSTVNDNGYFGIVAFQRNVSPGMIENVEISHCAFMNNNPTNKIQGHTIYFEKLRNSVFKNLSVVMPTGNVRIGIDINLFARLDYSNIQILDSRIFRETAGSGVWVQARNDLIDPPAALNNVVIRGMTFHNCDTNIAFNRQVNDMTVDKCDLSTYGIYGLVNYTDQGGTINASNNKWKNGDVPDTTVISGGLLVSGNNIISFMPSTDGIFIGMGIQGPGIPPGTTVTNISPNTVTMSNPATLDGFVPQIGFAFNFAISTDLVRTSLNFIHYSSIMAHSIINQANVSFPNLNAAIAGTTNGGTIWNVPFGTISGTTVIDKNLKLISPGSGFLYPGSLTSFENLSISSATLTMGSDFEVTGNCTPNRIIIGNENTLMISGAIVPGGIIEGGNRSDMYFSGSNPSTGLTTVQNGLSNLRINRGSGITLEDNLLIYNLLFLQNGNIGAGNFDLTIEPEATVFNPFPASSYVATNGSGVFRRNLSLSSPTYFSFPIGNAGYSPNSVMFKSWSLSAGANVTSKVVASKHPANTCAVDFLKRYWVVRENNTAPFNADTRYDYLAGDVEGTESNLVGARYDGSTWNSYTPVDVPSNYFKANNISEFGDFSSGGVDCISGTIVNAKMYLEGAYSGGGNMRINLNNFGLIPLTQPYNTAPFNYSGTETVISIPANVVDWVYIELRSTSNGGPVPDGRRAAFIKNDGQIVDLNGTDPVKFPTVPNGNYFIVIGHRNHLPVMTASAQLLNSITPLYDFSLSLTQYFGSEAAALSGGGFGMFGGDATRSFLITAADYNFVTANLGMSNYNYGDLNLSGIVTASDYNIVSPNLGKFSRVPNYP
ncbi:MAG: hypothetical protein HGGPFJEG_01852 [Ignavibacteria bacterium]|nr:hypothetical protein [Ignavibacteria bacterium]